MMLRNGKSSFVGSDARPENAGPLKRPGEAVKGEVKRRRGGLSDLSNVMSNTLLIDSSKRAIATKPAKQSGLKVRDANVVQKQEVVKKEDTKKSGSILEGFKQAFHKARLLPTVEKIEEESEKENGSPECMFPKEEEEIDPCPGYDYDLQFNGYFEVSEYARDIFKYYKHREDTFIVGDYLKRQKYYSKKARMLAVDWLVSLQENYEIQHETLYLAIKVLDLFLDTTEEYVCEPDTQLLCSTAVFIASKFEERMPPEADELRTACDNTFSAKDLFRMERAVLNTIRYDLGCPLAYRYLRRFAKVLRLDMRSLTLARYYLETITLYYEFLGVPESLKAAACLLLALNVKRIQDWDSVLVKYSGYRREDVEPMMWEVNHAVRMRQTLHSKVKSVFNKYASEPFFEVALLPLLPNHFKPDHPVGPPPDLSFPGRE